MCILIEVLLIMDTNLYTRLVEAHNQYHTNGFLPDQTMQAIPVNLPRYNLVQGILIKEIHEKIKKSNPTTGWTIDSVCNRIWIPRKLSKKFATDYRLALPIIEEVPQHWLSAPYIHSLFSLTRAQKRPEPVDHTQVLAQACVQPRYQFGS